jgi:sulfate transport system substrate-binding protein
MRHDRSRTAIAPIQRRHAPRDLIAAARPVAQPATGFAAAAAPAASHHSLPVFLVRRGNPKNIHTWADLVKTSVGVVMSGPETSSTGKHGHLAAYAFELDRTGNPARARAFARKLLNYVVAPDATDRAALKRFVRLCQGDVLVTFEAHALRAALGDDRFEVVMPPVSVIAGFPLTSLDRAVDRLGSPVLTAAWLKLLRGQKAQQGLARRYYRVSDQAVSAEHRRQFRLTRILSVEPEPGEARTDTEIRRPAPRHLHSRAI